MNALEQIISIAEKEKMKIEIKVSAHKGKSIRTIILTESGAKK